MYVYFMVFDLEGRNRSPNYALSISESCVSASSSGSQGLMSRCGMTICGFVESVKWGYLVSKSSEGGFIWFEVKCDGIFGTFCFIDGYLYSKLQRFLSFECVF